MMKRGTVLVVDGEDWVHTGSLYYDEYEREGLFLNHYYKRDAWACEHSEDYESAEAAVAAHKRMVTKCSGRRTRRHMPMAPVFMAVGLLVGWLVRGLF